MIPLIPAHCLLRPPFFFIITPRPPGSTLFPYTTLFRSRAAGRWRRRAERDCRRRYAAAAGLRSEEHTSELQSPYDLVCRLLLEKKNKRVFLGTGRLPYGFPQRPMGSKRNPSCARRVGWQ